MLSVIVLWLKSQVSVTAKPLLPTPCNYPDTNVQITSWMFDEDLTDSRMLFSQSMWHCDYCMRKMWKRRKSINLLKVLKIALLPVYFLLIFHLHCVSLTKDCPKSCPRRTTTQFAISFYQWELRKLFRNCQKYLSPIMKCLSQPYNVDLCYRNFTIFYQLPF